MRVIPAWEVVAVVMDRQGLRKHTPEKERALAMRRAPDSIEGDDGRRLHRSCGLSRDGLRPAARPSVVRSTEVRRDALTASGRDRVSR